MPTQQVAWLRVTRTRAWATFLDGTGATVTADGQMTYKRVTTAYGSLEAGIEALISAAMNDGIFLRRRD